MKSSPGPGLKLPLVFDQALLERDLKLIAPDEWTPHYNERDFGGQWTGVSLRSPSGSHTDLNAGPPGPSGFSANELLDRCRYFQSILSTLHCPLKAVRLLSLSPRSFIREHSDHALAFEDGEVRIHIPIQTNPDVEFYVCGQRLRLDPGGCYYINVNLPHRVSNRGSEPRIHLVIDALVNDWVRDLFGTATAIPKAPVPPRFENFAARVFTDEAMRNRLLSAPARPELIRAIVEESRPLGLDLNEADIDASPTAVRPGVDLRQWLPTAIEFRESPPHPWATWIYAPAARLSEPFYEDSIRLRLRQPFTRLFCRKAPLLNSGPSVRPAGFIFHMSRCGSTLISRSLAAARSTFVLSEPPPLDEILGAKPHAEGEPGLKAEWLESIVSALCRPGAADGTACILKLDAWHIHDLPLFRAVFPDVPWIFCYRDPLEVLVSHLRHPGLQSSPGAMDPSRLGMRIEDITALNREQWTTRVLRHLMESALQFSDDPLGLYLDYRELPEAICRSVASHLGLTLSEDDEARVLAAAQFNAKFPQTEFADDTEEKKIRIAELQAGADLEILTTLYRRLREIRQPA